ALDLLNRIVGEALPLGLRSGPVEPFFQRDVYFDSADWALRRRGVTCRLRFRVDDRRTLTVRTVGGRDGRATSALPHALAADVPGAEAPAAGRRAPRPGCGGRGVSGAVRLTPAARGESRPRGEAAARDRERRVDERRAGRPRGGGHRRRGGMRRGPHGRGLTDTPGAGR